MRELENFIERAVILTNGAALNVPIAELRMSAPVNSSEDSSLEATERAHILRILRETNGILSGPQGAAARLGLNRSTLQHRMKKLGITRGHYN